MLKISSFLDTTLALSTFEELEDITEFVGGPGCSDKQIVLDDVFAVTLTNTLEALANDFNVAINPAEPVAKPEWEIVATLGDFNFVLPQDEDGVAWAGVIAVDPSLKIVGAYTGCTLAVDPDVRNQGIGTALTVLRFLIFEGLPLWDHDKAGYSFGGYATHCSAFRKLLRLLSERTL
jgi:GNAT superfamily N-acetyltransferase